MSEHTKKKIAPIIISVLLVAYYLIYFCFLIAMLPGIAKILLGIIPLALAVVVIYVCIERIREIDGGEEDDLSKY
ncbi:MAG: hypothetical protein K5662_05145 [Lachnospiraceae bacterium]|nr:hypothetical protein [Lachnospiraceae bacterium]